MKIHKQWTKLFFLLSARGWIEETRRVDKDKEQFSAQNWLRWVFGKVLWHFWNFSHFRIFSFILTIEMKKLWKQNFLTQVFRCGKLARIIHCCVGIVIKIWKKSVKILIFIGRKKVIFRKKFNKFSANFFRFFSSSSLLQKNVHNLT